MVIGDGGRSGMARSSLSTASMSKPSPAWASMARRSMAATKSALLSPGRADSGSTALAMTCGSSARIGCKRPTTVSNKPIRFPESAVYVGLDRAVVVQVDDAYGGVGLTDTVDAADPFARPASGSTACRS